MVFCSNAPDRRRVHSNFKLLFTHLPFFFFKKNQPPFKEVQLSKRPYVPINLSISLLSNSCSLVVIRITSSSDMFCCTSMDGGVCCM